MLLNDQQDGSGASMVAEIVNPDCAKGKHDDGNKSHVDKYLRTAKQAFEEMVVDSTINGKGELEEPIPVIVTGIGFFDTFNHGSGQSANYMEMHPILEIVKP